MKDEAADRVGDILHFLYLIYPGLDYKSTLAQIQVWGSFKIKTLTLFLNEILEIVYSVIIFGASENFALCFGWGEQKKKLQKLRCCSGRGGVAKNLMGNPYCVVLVQISGWIRVILAGRSAVS